MILVVFIVWPLPVFLGYSIGKTRSMGGTNGLLLGFFLSYLGVIIVALSSRAQPPMFYNFNTKSSAPSSAADELKKYKDLLDSGAISEEEYKLQKARILG